MSTRKHKPAPRARRAPAPTEFIVPGLSVEAFRSVTRQPDAGKKQALTMREFQQQLLLANLPCGEDKTRQTMRALVAAGWARPVRKNVVSLSGVTQPVAAYEFLDKQEVKDA
jgi:hypothetical protein